MNQAQRLPWVPARTSLQRYIVAVPREPVKLRKREGFSFGVTLQVLGLSSSYYVLACRVMTGLGMLASFEELADVIDIVSYLRLTAVNFAHE